MKTTAGAGLALAIAGPRAANAQGSGSGANIALIMRQYELGDEVEVLSGGHATPEEASAAAKALAKEAIFLAAGGEGSFMTETWGDPTGMTGPGVWFSDAEGEEPTFYPIGVSQDGDGTWTGIVTIDPGVVTIHYYI